jgi:c-di-GMP-binding flagellar brake protein YcgR
MNNLLEQRISIRYKVDKKIKAMALTKSGHVICQIDDISMGGIALSFENGKLKPFQPEEISILYQENFWGVSGLPVKLIWQKEEGNTKGSLTRKKIGLCFQNIGHKKKSQLKYFIKHFSKQEN